MDGGWSSAGPQFHAGRVDVSSADVKLDPWQRSRRRPRGGPSRSQVEMPLVARAKQVPAIRPRNDRAREMRALLTVGDQLRRSEPHEHAGVMLARIVEHQCFADGQEIERREAADLAQATALAEPVLRRNPELADGHREARQNQELDEV